MRKARNPALLLIIIIALLLSKFAINANSKADNLFQDGRKEEQNNALISAAKKYDTASVKILLAAGADVNAKDNNGRTALMNAAAGSRNTETMKELLAAGAE